MASSSYNTATHGAKQSNFAVDIALTKNVHYHLNSRTSAVAAAQQFGSPLDTRYSYQGLQELIETVNNGNIVTRRFHGQNVYDQEVGKIMTAFGITEQVSMHKITTVDGEKPTFVGTIIVCLSVFFGRSNLSSVLVSALLLNVHGFMDQSMGGVATALQATMDKYAVAVLSRDAMCNKLENAKQTVRSLLRHKASHLSTHNIYLPPKVYAEEEDFAEFLVRLWKAQSEGDKIYTRSLKLLALALLLTEYGWQIDVFVEKIQDGRATEIAIRSDTRALSVIYSSVTATNDDRNYVENHERYLENKQKSRDYYPTAMCRASQTGEVFALTITKTQEDQDDVLLGYDIATKFFRKHCKAAIKLSPAHIKLIIDYQAPGTPPCSQPSGCAQRLINGIVGYIPEEIGNIVESVLYEVCPGQDWSITETTIRKQHWDTTSRAYLANQRNGQLPHITYTVLLSDKTVKSQRLGVALGAILGILNQVIRSLVNISDDTLIRIPSYQGIDKYIRSAARSLEELLGSDGLDRSRVVKLCALWVTGVSPDAIEFGLTKETDQIMGYWNAQQGLLFTPALERSLFFDIPQERRRILTMYNIPIMGVPANDRGWIRFGFLPPPLHRVINPTSKLPRDCEVVIEYRPHFEEDSHRVVAAAYLNGTFYNIFSLVDLFSYQCHRSQCGHQRNSGPSEGETKYISIEEFQSGEVSIPQSNQLVLIGPQNSIMSRFLCGMMYNGASTVIQEGCIGCATKMASDEKASVILPAITEIQNTSPEEQHWTSLHAIHQTMPVTGHQVIRRRPLEESKSMNRIDLDSSRTSLLSSGKQVGELPNSSEDYKSTTKLVSDNSRKPLLKFVQRVEVLCLVLFVLALCTFVVVSIFCYL